MDETELQASVELYQSQVRIVYVYCFSIYIYSSLNWISDVFMLNEKNKLQYWYFVRTKWGKLSTLLPRVWLFNGPLHQVYCFSLYLPPPPPQLDCLLSHPLTHWGRVTHICVGNLTMIGSDNGLLPGQRQAIIWTNTGILLIWPLETNFNEILIKILIVSLKKMHLKGSSAKWWPFCLCLNVLIKFWYTIKYVI